MGRLFGLFLDLVMFTRFMYAEVRKEVRALVLSGQSYYFSLFGYIWRYYRIKIQRNEKYKPCCTRKYSLNILTTVEVW